jgi:hypothetical protein
MNQKKIQLPGLLLKGTEHETDIEYALGIAASEHHGHPSLRRIGNFAIPVWQRDPVWDVARQIAFVEGVFLGLGTGYFVATEMDWDQSGPTKLSALLIDGQQRLGALSRFYEGDLVVFGNVRYRDLDEVTLRRRFLRVKFPWIGIPAEDETTLKELYRRLNYVSVPHTTADMARLDAAM